MAALQRIAEHCEYRDPNEMIRDRLVCGVNHDTIQRRLLAEKDLTFAKALEVAQAVEAAEKNSQFLKKGSQGAGVNYVPAGSKPGGPPTCYRCGLSAIKARLSCIFDHFYMQVLRLIIGQKRH